MERRKWEQVKDIFDAALKRAPDERAPFLSENCNGDDELRREVESLLSSFDSANSFLQKPAVGEVADVVVGTNNHLPEGQRLSHYEIIRQIGAGGMGEVYLAEDTKLHRRVAIKLVPTSLSSDQNANRRLLREARAAATLNHPHICQIHEISETDGRSFIVMQYVEGETLAEKIERENLTLGETLDLAIQIADALANAHSHHVIHRDIKPANIINNQGQAKILDFGLAKIIAEKLNVESEAEAAQLSSAANMIIGTVPYMSPEQVCGKPLDARTDIFSFGVLLYEMLSGTNLFSRESQAETISAVLNYEPPIAKTLADTPPELQRIVRKALIKNRDERYQTAKDLLVDLEVLQKRLEFEAELFRERKNVAASSNVSASPRPSASESPLPPNNLPENLSPIIGREKEITAIRDLLQSENVQLITMTGIGGTGKTRLAQAVARRLLTSFDDGVFFIELAAITDAELVASTIAQPLEVKEAGGKPILEILKDHLRDKRVLIVVDNFEQVIDAAPKIAELISATRKLKILITSRMPLHLGAEREFVVPPLVIPSANLFDNYPSAHASDSDLLDDLQKYEAVKLFIERARNAKSNFALTAKNARSVAEICARLDGLPLAIELAAARIRILSPQAILAKLENRLKLLTSGARDLPARQQTMRGAVEWSYELLNEDEKRLFRRLAVFAGGFTIESAEAVVLSSRFSVSSSPEDKLKFELKTPTEGGTLNEIDVLDLITSLVDKSLLVSKEQADGESRFRMLEVVREYALDHLEVSDEAEAMRHNHATYFLALAEEAEPHLQGAQPAKWLNCLEEEHDNLREALRWSLAYNVGMVTRLAAAIRYFWVFQGYLTQGLKWSEEILKLSDGVPTAARWKILSMAGNMARYQGDYETARRMYEEGLTQGRAADDLPQISLSCRGLGGLALEQGDYTTARRFSEEALSVARESNDKYGIARSLNMLGDLARTVGNDERARPLFEEALTICRQLDNKYAIGNILTNLAAAEYGLCDYTSANSHFAEALTMSQKLGGKILSNKIAISYVLDGFAALAVQRGESEMAARLAGAAERLRESINYNIEPAERRFRAVYLTELKTKMDEAAFAKLYEQGHKMKLEEVIALCLVKTGDKHLSPLILPARKLAASPRFLYAALAMVLLIIGIIGFGYYLRSAKDAPSNDKKSIAVLPFVNESGNADAEYLSDGISESLINSLSALRTIKVIARSTAFSYKNRQSDPREVGREIGVDTILTGKVRLLGDTVIVQTDLISVADGTQIWGERYTRKLSDLSSVPENISREILTRLQPKLSSEANKQLAELYPDNSQAYLFDLQGRYTFWNRRTEEGLRTGIGYFEQAIAEDPNYALAYVGLADSYNLMGFYAFLPPYEAFPKAKAAAKKALELNENLAEAHNSLAYGTLYYDWDFVAAEKEFLRAIELKPNYAVAHQWYGNLLTAKGRWNEALQSIKRAQELDPLNPVRAAVPGWTYFYARHYDKAIETCQKAIEMDRNIALLHFWLGQAYERKGDYKRAVSEFQEAVRISKGAPEETALLAHAYAVSGDEQQARMVLNNLIEQSKQRYVSPYLIATIHMGLGDKNSAFKWLDTAYQDRQHVLIFLNYDPRLDDLRPDPRFQDLLKKIGFPQK